MNEMEGKKKKKPAVYISAAAGAKETQGAAGDVKPQAPRFTYAAGDIVKLKKPHPCGSYEWKILRVGADFKLKCLGCEHQMMLPRRQVEKSTKQVRSE